jgi:hypothetical protein
MLNGERRISSFKASNTLMSCVEAATIRYTSCSFQAFMSRTSSCHSPCAAARCSRPRRWSLTAETRAEEGIEVAAAIVTKHDRLAVNQRLVRREAANRVGDPEKTIGEVGGAAAPHVDALALL